MPLTIWLNGSIIPYLDTSQLTEVYNKLIGIVSEIFEFSPKDSELWKNSTSTYLDGERVYSYKWEELGTNSRMIDLVSKAVDEHYIIVIKGTCGADLEARIEIYGKSSERKIYSDFLFEMGIGLFDYLEKSDNQFYTLSKLHEYLDRSKIQFVTTKMKKTMSDERKVVESAFISDNILDEGNIEESSMLFFYKMRGHRDLFFKYVVNSVLSELRKEKKSDPFVLFDSGKIARSISHFSKKRGFTIEKYANVLPGSVSYIAKNHETLDTMFDDLKTKVTEPILKRMSEKFDPERIMEESVTELGPGSLDNFEKSD